MKRIASNKKKLSRVLIVGLSFLFSIGLIISGLGGSQTKDNSSVLGVKDSEIKTISQICNGSNLVLGITNKQGTKQIATVFKYDDTSYQCFSSEKEAIDAGYKN